MPLMDQQQGQHLSHHIGNLPYPQSWLCKAGGVCQGHAVAPCCWGVFDLGHVQLGCDNSASCCILNATVHSDAERAVTRREWR